MPKKDYSKTVLYKIVCKDINITDIYIGHTTNFDKRRYDHKSHCNNEKNTHYNLKVYQFIRDNGGWNNWEIIIIEDYPCNDIYEALKRENYWAKELKSKLNTQIPSRIGKEWREDNKEILAKRKKEYYENNKEKIAKKKKEYYENNKEKIAEKDKEKIKCECGCIIKKGNLSKHRKTQKHLSLLKLETDGNTN